MSYGPPSPPPRTVFTFWVMPALRLLLTRPALVEGLAHDGGTVVGGGDVADRAAHRRTHRGDRAQHDPLVPEILVDVGVEPALDAGLLARGIELVESRSPGFAVTLAKRHAG